jgi:hypothetical protein
MLLKEMFSPLGGAKEQEQQIDWLGDLKFFIDNEDRLLKTEMFPAIKKHMQYRNHPQSYKFYIKPLKRCCRAYCAKFQINDPENKFPKQDMIGLAKHIAEEQAKFIDRGDYGEFT